MENPLSYNNNRKERKNSEKIGMVPLNQMFMEEEAVQVAIGVQQMSAWQTVTR